MVFKLKNEWPECYENDVPLWNFVSAPKFAISEEILCKFPESDYDALAFELNAVLNKISRKQERYTAIHFIQAVDWTFNWIALDIDFVATNSWIMAMLTTENQSTMCASFGEGLPWSVYNRSDATLTYIA